MLYIIFNLIYHMAYSYALAMAHAILRQKPDPSSSHTIPISIPMVSFVYNPEITSDDSLALTKYLCHKKF